MIVLNKGVFTLELSLNVFCAHLFFVHFYELRNRVSEG